MHTSVILWSCASTRPPNRPPGPHSGSTRWQPLAAAGIPEARRQIDSFRLGIRQKKKRAPFHHLLFLLHSCYTFLHPFSTMSYACYTVLHPLCTISYSCYTVERRWGRDGDRRAKQFERREGQEKREAAKLYTYVCELPINRFAATSNPR